MSDIKTESTANDSHWRKTIARICAKMHSFMEKYCPDYEIKEWNENNFDINCCAYVKEAYDVKMWAFVSDYARFKILHENGGLYFDTDVESIQPIDDIVEKGPFMGFEEDADEGFEGRAAAGLGLYKEVLDAYEMRHFRRADGSLDKETVVTFMTKILSKHGLKNKKGIQFVEGVYLYPSEYFCPIDYKTGEYNQTDNTRSIHHFDASWHTPKDKYIQEIKKNIKSFFQRSFQAA